MKSGKDIRKNIGMGTPSVLHSTRLEVRVKEALMESAFKNKRTMAAELNYILIKHFDLE